MAVINLGGQKVNKLRVLHRVENVGNQPAWLCKCECGVEKRFLGMHLRAGTTHDCGCGTLKRRSDAIKRHGRAGTPEHRTWCGLIHRCACETSPSWKNYGGRGITVCNRWLKFENFFEDMGLRPEGMTLDRKDNSKGYGPDNCRWATVKEQQNNRRSNVYLTLEGEVKTLKQWATHFRVKYAVVKARRANGVTGTDLFAASPRKVYGRTIEFNGEAKTLTQWSKTYNVTYQEMWKRINLWGQHPDGNTSKEQSYVDY